MYDFGACEFVIQKKSLPELIRFLPLFTPSPQSVISEIESFIPCPFLIGT